MQKNEREEIIDDFESELEDEGSSNAKRKLLFLLIGGTIALTALAYHFVNSLEEKKPKEVKKQLEGEIQKKKFELPFLPKKTVEKKEVLPLIPPTAKKRISHYHPKIIKSEGVTLVKFDSSRLSPEKNPTLTKESKKDTTHEPFRGGEYSVAGIHHLDPNLYLPKGTYIGCSLKTRLVSMVTGHISCTVSNNIYSANGNVLLIERGSELIGSYTSGTLQDGMDRHFVVWDELRTRDGIMVSLSSPATDELGSAGIHGNVDYHWELRLGTALMFSLIDDSIGALAQNMSDQKIAYYPTTTQNTVEDVTNTLLNKFIDIKPTLYKNHGDIVGVYVNKDIDFSKVYRLKRRGNTE